MMVKGVIDASGRFVCGGSAAHAWAGRDGWIALIRYNWIVFKHKRGSDLLYPTSLLRRTEHMKMYSIHTPYSSHSWSSLNKSTTWTCNLSRVLAAYIVIYLLVCKFVLDTYFLQGVLALETEDKLYRQGSVLWEDYRYSHYSHKVINIVHTCT